jgi:glucose-6-phosphate isomerase, archaeal
MSDVFATRTHEKMQEVLLDPDASGPDVHYWMIRGGSKKGNITVWESGLVGREYIKTYGHYHVDALPETYWFLAGEGIALLQKKAGDGSDPSLLDVFKAIPVKAGDRLDIPAGWGHLVVNTGATFLVTQDDSPVAGIGDSASMPRHADYSDIQKMRGFAYYVIKDEGKPALLKNNQYRNVGAVECAHLKIID